MKVTMQRPPNYKAICKVFDVENREDIVFTYGDTIYTPYGHTVDDYIMFHEEVHQEQQGNYPKKWWEKYLVDSQFRFNQELEAYRVQYQEYCRDIKDRNKRARYLWGLAGDLSSSMYGKVVTLQEALQLIESQT